jgi:hypothetical protein
MPYIEADCSILKKDDEVLGVSLIAQPQTEAEFFCGSMPRQIAEKKGDIKIEDGKIIFVNPLEGEVSFSISDEDGTKLKELMKSGRKFGIYNDGCLTPGFKIVPVEMEHEKLERVELERL